MPREQRPDESSEDYWASLHADITSMIADARKEAQRLRDKLREMFGDESDPACGVRKDKPKKR